MISWGACSLDIEELDGSNALIDSVPHFGWVGLHRIGAGQAFLDLNST
jgi:hypothetical protein